MVAQSPDLWENQGFSRDILINQDDNGISWMGNEDCLNNIKDSQYDHFNNSGNDLVVEDSLCNNFYDCSELDESMHCYLIKGLLGETVLRENATLGLPIGNSEKNMRVIGNDSSGNNVNNNINGSDMMNVKVGCNVDNNEDSVIHFNTIINDLETNIFSCNNEANSQDEAGDVFMSKQQINSNNCYDENNDVIQSSIIFNIQKNTNNNSDSPLRSTLSSTSNIHMSSPLSRSSLSQSQNHSVLSPSVCSSSPFQANINQPCNSNNSYELSSSSYELDNSQKKIRMIDPENCIKMGILDVDIQESDFDLISNQTGINEYEFNNNSLNTPNIGDNVYNQGNYCHSNNCQVTELDSSKGRRWSNNSTTSTISSSFSTNNVNGIGNGISGQIINKVSKNDVLENGRDINVGVGIGGSLGLCGNNVVKKEQFEEVSGCYGNISELIESPVIVGVCNTNVSNIADINNNSNNHLSKHNNIGDGINLGSIDGNINNNDGINNSNYDITLMEEDQYQTEGNIENEFYLNSNNYLTEDEKLKLRRRGRRRRPGKCDRYCFIICH
ncbi:hypothetical protein RS030_283713 [Cryptosporidium xiaoi]|uniref:Uncharacterized protein n=1 Tax=Cryptosporidium xiaoi TaxID=659607 RepID=A0AAV9XW44_9CRYT